MKNYLSVLILCLAVNLGYCSNIFAQSSACDLKIKLADNELHSNNNDGKHEHMVHGMGEKHQVHKPQFGGSFFMAPNQTNHIEGIYTRKCGMRLVIFDAWTRPIDARNFGAFVKYIPDNEDLLETVRILMPSENGTILHSPGKIDIEGEFAIVLYVKFPESDEPVMFNIKH